MGGLYLQQVIGVINILVLVLMMNWASADPTDGFKEVPLNPSKYHVQKPYNLPITQRYSLVDGVHRLWVYSTDDPLYKNSPTNPRTEVKISGYRYSSNVWQFEGYLYVPHGTSGVCVMQVFGAGSHATTLQLRVYDGSLMYYRVGPVLASNIYDRWMRVNVIHDVDASTVKIYIDGTLKHVAPGRGGDSHYFKYGVYGQDHESHYMESRWKNIKVLKKYD